MRVLLVLILLSGCVSNIVNGRREVVTWQGRLMPLAAFQLNCHEMELTVVNLGSNGEQAGVYGCDQRATYVYNSGRSTWERLDTVPPPSR